MSRDLTKFDVINDLPDPLLDWKWVCVSLPHVGVSIPVSYVESVSLPFPHVQQKGGLFGGGTYTYYPAFEDIDAFDVVLYEDRYLTSTKWLKSWFNLIRNPVDGSYYLPTNYKKDMQIELHDQEGTSICRVTLENIWPTAKGNWDLAYNTNGRLQCHQNFSVDSSRIEFLV